jgi:protein-arginine kinase activator protein McsA
MLEFPKAEDVAEDVKERRCLSCTMTFTSLWAGERVCKRCKQSATWRSGVAHKPARVG